MDVAASGIIWHAKPVTLTGGALASVSLIEVIFWWLGHSYMWSFDISSGLFQFMVRVLVRIAASGGWPAWYDRSYLLLPGIYHLIEIMPMKWRHPWANNVSKSPSLKLFTCRFDPTGSLWSYTTTIFGADHALESFFKSLQNFLVDQSLRNPFLFGVANWAGQAWPAVLFDGLYECRCRYVTGCYVISGPSR